MWLNEKESKRYFERQELLKAFAELFPYNEGDDRAIVIIGGSFLETLLEHVLIEFFPDDKEVDRLLNYDQPLGNYGNKARMIFCLGLIEKLVYHDLKLIGKIRNKFAHDMRASFEDQQIQQWCSELRWHLAALTEYIPPDVTHRDLYQVGVHQVICHLNGVVSIAYGQKRKIVSNF